MVLTSPDIVGLLEGAEFFQDWPRQLLEAVASRSRKLSLPKETLIFSPGSEPALYLLVSGLVMILARPTVATEVEVFTCWPHDTFGELSPLLGVHIDEARSSTAVQLLRFRGGELRIFLQIHSEAALPFARFLANRAATAELRLGETTPHSIKLRALFVLRRLAAQRGVRDSRGVLLPEFLTHERVARMIGASRVAVTHALAGLRREGRILVDGRRLILVDDLCSDSEFLSPAPGWQLPRNPRTS